MKSVKKLLLFAIILFGVSFALIGCGADSATDENGNKIYTVATDATYAPMEYMDKDGNIVGLDIEIVKAIAEEMDITVEFKNYGWDPLFAAVDNDEVDFAVSSITITDERKESYGFTDPYFAANQLILVPEDSTVTKFDDLKDKKVAVQINTTGHIVTRGLLGDTSADIVAAETLPFAIGEMINGNADAAIGDNVVIIEYQKNNPNVKLKTVDDPAFEKEFYGLMVKKGNTELLELLNEGIAKLKANGKLKEITGIDVE
ncbi:basic amino acid ABC transporter substrate-binding protein [Paenisporosarcina sp. TG20]|uniref:basic amino acid ABC transporter substrate-binding protein n=1 Tax=Paenisporosarcina sp. TG20 TaxID=1211706 RepID=UPI0002D751DF|nr:basic amino acid ABC transporter substrate-binding protein [Paenisporosarcina sp. TG20]